VIYYTTSWSDIEDLDELYSEWVGHVPEFKDVSSNLHHIVARDKKDNKFIGAAQLIVVVDKIWDRRWGLVENVYVAKAYRNQGVATEIMRHVETTAQFWDCKFIKLTSSHDKTAGHALYKSLGYEEGYSFRKEIKKNDEKVSSF